MTTDITAVCVTYETAGLFRECYEAFRMLYPEMQMIIIDGSDPSDPCYHYVKSLEGDCNKVIQTGSNIGHGKGMDIAIGHARTKYVLLLDSDCIIQRNCLPEMLRMFDSETYGVGEIYLIGRDGLHVNPVRDVPYLRPYFALVSREQYYKYPPYIHHGSPCIMAMLEHPVIKHYPVYDYVRHDFAGTRAMNKSKGRREIPGKWDINLK